ncbi:MAG: nitrate reductase, partial [Propionibacterium sp.]|nr:nitrate reductase [Propionibacterium sp.]
WRAPKRLSDAALDGSGVLFDAPGSYSARPLIPPATRPGRAPRPATAPHPQADGPAGTDPDPTR